MFGTIFIHFDLKHRPEAEWQNTVKVNKLAESSRRLKMTVTDAENYASALVFNDFLKAVRPVAYDEIVSLLNQLLCKLRLFSASPVVVRAPVWKGNVESIVCLRDCHRRTRSKGSAAWC